MTDGSVSDWLVAVQAVAAAVSAATAFYLVRATVRRDTEARAERERDVAHEQLRRLVDGLEAFADVLHDQQASRLTFEVARAEISAALAMRRAPLPACERLLDENLLAPPYAFGDTEPWNRLEGALVEVRRYAQSAAVVEAMQRGVVRIR